MSVVDQMPTTAAQRFEGSAGTLLLGLAIDLLETGRGFAGSGVEEVVATSDAAAVSGCSEADASAGICSSEAFGCAPLVVVLSCKRPSKLGVDTFGLRKREFVILLHLGRMTSIPL